MTLPSDFNDFLNLLLHSQESGKTILILGKERIIKGITKLSSINYRNDIGYYYKIFFTDHSSLIVIPQEKQIQFSSEGDLGAISEIADQDVGVRDTVKYQGKSYKLENAGDYQYTLELVFGDFEDVEGECRFSDYVNIDDPDDFLSLGWLVKSGKRADVHAKTIRLSDIVIN